MKRRRIIDQLREVFGGSWKYNQDDYSWENNRGLVVRAYSHTEISPSGSESYHTVYHREDSGEAISFGNLIFNNQIF